MPYFTVYLTATASTSLDIAADTYDEALEKVWEEDLPTICAQCSGWNNPPGIDLGDFDTVEVTDNTGKTVWQEK